MMKKKLSGYSLTALTLAMCTQRMSIAVGNIFYGLAIVLFLVDVIERRRRGETFHLAPHVKHYFWAYAFFALTLLPSALLSPDVSFSFGKYLNSIVGRIVVLPMLLFLDVDEKAIKKALLCFIAFIAFDGLCTFGERLITGADRAHGLGDGWLRHASIVATVFPASIILWLQKAEKISHRNGLLGAAVLIVLGAIGSGTRSSWVGIFVSVILVTAESLRERNSRIVAVLLALSCSFAVIAASPALSQRFFSISNVTTDRSNGDRIEAWKKAAVMIQDKPVFGFGILQGGKAYLAHYRTKADTQGLHHFHNIYVQTAVDSGLVGLMGLASWILSSFYLFRHVENPYAFAGFCAWIGFCTVGMFDYTLGMSAAVKTLLFMTGCCLRLETSLGNKEEKTL